eukprot:IDg7483t1
MHPMSDAPAKRVDCADRYARMCHVHADANTRVRQPELQSACAVRRIARLGHNARLSTRPRRALCAAAPRLQGLLKLFPGARAYARSLS